MASEAQIRANQANAQKSTGPTSDQGKAISRANSLKHGMTGQGVVMSELNHAEVEDRVAAYEADLKPYSSLGVTLIRCMAINSLQMDISIRHQLANQSTNVRHAGDAFDEARFDEADHLFDTLGENPQKNLRKLRKSPEGVDRLIDGWENLKADLTCDQWTAAHIQRAANLVGMTVNRLKGIRLGILARAACGDFLGLSEADGGLLDQSARQAWSRAGLVECIDGEILGLQAHRKTLDFDAIDLDRAEAGDRALLDTSKEGLLARRYDAAAERHFFKALKEFRQVEAEAIELAEALSAPRTTPISSGESGSFCEPMMGMPQVSGRAALEAEYVQLYQDVMAMNQRNPMGQPSKSPG